MSRVIKLKLLTQNELVKVETSARTLGEFKNELTVQNLGIDWSSTKLIDRATKASFDLDEAVLPATDALIFVTPTKTKSGAYSYREAIEAVKTYKANGGKVNFNYTHASTKQLNDFLNTIEKVEEARAAQNKAEKALEELAEDIEAEEFIPMHEIAEVLTNTELQEEAEKIAAKI